MNHPLGLWMTDNAELFRYAGELMCMREKADRILLSGTASVFLAPLFRTLYPESTIIASDSDREALREEAEECFIVADPVPFQSKVYDDIDIAVSVLAIQTLDTRELTGYLYNLSDSLVSGGNLYISFPSYDHFVFDQMKEVESWYQMDRKVRMKRYQPDDVVRALSMLSFSIRAVEKDENPDLGTVISIHAVKR